MTGVPKVRKSESIVHGSTMGSVAPHTAFEKSKEDADHLETVLTNLSVIDQDAKVPNAIEALGIEDWHAKEKKIVRRLDMTLLPQLWILYSMEWTSAFNHYCHGEQILSSVQLPQSREYCVSFLRPSAVEFCNNDTIGLSSSPGHRF